MCKKGIVMREIKFRAWDHIEMNIPILGGFNDMNDEISNLIFDGVILMQYTGLKDKNGKEIYEGDIIRKGLDLSSYNLVSDIQEVVFEDGCFQGKQQKGIGYIKFALSAYLNEIEVIGNIYESKELLK